MPVRFTIGHVGGGTMDASVPPARVEKRLVQFLEELYEADDEHYQGYVTNAEQQSITVYDGGLMVLDSLADGPPVAERFYRPKTMAAAVKVLVELVNLRRRGYAPRFRAEKPPPRPGLNFLLKGMGPFALHKAAWSRNLERVKELVKAGHDVNQRTLEGTTPLMGAVSEGQLAMCKFLLKHGADATVRLPAGWGAEERSLLRQAREDGNDDIAKLLKKAGAAEE